MKVIELLEKIAKGELLPKKIEVFDEVFELDADGVYRDNEGWTLEDYALLDYLNDEVKILEITMKWTNGEVENEYTNRQN